MSKRVIKVRDALTGKVREVVLPGKPVGKKPVKKSAKRDIRVDLKADVGEFKDAVDAAGGDPSGADIG